MIHTYVTFDPRTKMLLLMTMAIFVLGGAGDKLFGAYLPLFCLLPFVLFILVGKWKRAAGYIILYSVFYLLTVFVLPHMTGFIYIACILRDYDKVSAGNHGWNLSDADNNSK